MGTRCTICQHPEREQLERGVVQRVPNVRLAAQFGLTEMAIRRHIKHLPKLLAKAREAKNGPPLENPAAVRTLAGLLDDLHVVAKEVLESARADDDGKLMLLAAKERRELAALEFGTKSKVTTSTEDMTEEQIDARLAELGYTRRKK